MIRKFLVPLLLVFTLACQEQSKEEALLKTLQAKYRWFGEVSALRISHIERIKAKTYIAKVEFKLRFRESYETLRRKVETLFEGKELPKSPGPFIKALMLKDLRNWCGSFGKGSVCKLELEVILRKVRDSWAVDVI